MRAGGILAWDGDDWSALGEGGFAFAYDAPANRLIVVSGARTPTAGNPVNAAPDTWVLELGGQRAPSWHALAVDLTLGEAPRFRNACFAHDPEGRRLFVFGGTADGATSVPGLHVLELEAGRERWIDVVHDRLPPPRASCSGVWDSARGRFVLGLGNSETAVYRDLWFLGR